ncbi:hypothetical protein AV530_013345 [Patagioenas fasciata monilis]|uniref:Uncharacterized protein n=1 Tax=Patagioenas fasciata monilis TaxID=372326 RepID=A0A1V4JP22_PATFA|nr:hypothetical protein AV530_013345 [Patagioenas fasciata monilis]
MRTRHRHHIFETQKQARCRGTATPSPPGRGAERGRAELVVFESTRVTEYEAWKSFKVIQLLQAEHHHLSPGGSRLPRKAFGQSNGRPKDGYIFYN